MDMKKGEGEGHKADKIRGNCLCTFDEEEKELQIIDN